MMKKIIFAIIFLIITFSYYGCIKEKVEDEIIGTPIIFETLSKGGLSHQKEGVDYIINNQGDFENTWDIIFKTRVPKPELPDVNFSEEMVIAVFMGEMPTGGHSIEIKNLEEREKNIVVHYKIIIPEDEDIVSDMITSPYHIIKIKKLSKSILFKEKS